MKSSSQPYSKRLFLQLLSKQNCLVLTTGKVPKMPQRAGEAGKSWKDDYAFTFDELKEHLSKADNHIALKPHKLGLACFDYDGNDREEAEELKEMMGWALVIKSSTKPYGYHFYARVDKDGFAKKFKKAEKTNPLGYKGELKYDNGYAVLPDRGDNYQQLHKYLTTDLRKTVWHKSELIESSVAVSGVRNKREFDSLMERFKGRLNNSVELDKTNEDICEDYPDTPEYIGDGQGSRHKRFLNEMLTARRFPRHFSLDEVEARAIKSGLPRSEVAAIREWVEAKPEINFRINLPAAPSNVSLLTQAKIFFQCENMIPVFDQARQKMFFKRFDKSGGESLIVNEGGGLVEGNASLFAIMRLHRLNFMYQSEVAIKTAHGEALLPKIINRTKQDWAEVIEGIKGFSSFSGNPVMIRVKQYMHTPEAAELHRYVGLEHVEISSYEAAERYLKYHHLTKHLKVRGFTEGTTDKGGEPIDGEVTKEFVEYIRHVSTVTPIAIVARQVHPRISCKAHLCLISKGTNVGKSDYVKYLLDEDLREHYYQPRGNLKPSQHMEESEIFSNLGGRAVVEVAEVLSNISKGEQSEVFKSMTDISMFSCRLKYGRSDGMSTPATHVLIFTANIKEDRYISPDDSVAAQRLLMVPCEERTWCKDGSPIKRAMDGGDRVRTFAAAEMYRKHLFANGGLSKVEEYISTCPEKHKAEQMKLIIEHGNDINDEEAQLLMSYLAKGAFQEIHQRTGREWGFLDEFFNISHDTRLIRRPKRKRLMAECGFKEIRFKGQRVWRIDPVSDECKMMQLRKELNPQLYKFTRTNSQFDPTRPDLRLEETFPNLL